MMTNKKNKKIENSNIDKRKSVRKAYLLRRARYLDISSPETLPSSEIDNLVSENEVLIREKELFKDHLIRLKAEFENYRKRFERDKKDLVEKANEELFKEILPTLDQFDLALQSASNLPERDPFIDGMQMIRDNLLMILAAHGLKKIEAMGEVFNPYYHEAIAVEKSPGAKENQIITILREGYMYKDKVIRPTLVKVAKNE